jgi:hypothetical protein
MRVVPTVGTPLSATHARDALLAAAPDLDRETAALLLSLIWVESGGGGSLKNNNPGNITAGASWPGDAWLPPWFAPSSDPHLAALHARMVAGTAPSAFRSYPSAPDGFRDFVGTLRRQFRTVLDAGRSGDPAEFVRALHDSGYSRDYSPAHVGTFSHLRETTFGPLVSHLPAGAAGSAAGAIALVGALYLAWRYLTKG